MGNAHLQSRNNLGCTENKNEDRQCRHDGVEIIYLEVVIYLKTLSHIALMLFGDVSDSGDEDSSDNKRSNVGIEMEVNYFHYIYICDIGNEGIVSKTRVQHGSVGTALNSGGTHSRMDTGTHEDRNEDSTGGSGSTGSRRQSDVYEISSDNNAGDKKRTNLGDDICDCIDEMLIAAGEAHDHGKTHDRADCLDKAGIRHTLGKSVERIHRHTANGAHDNTCADKDDTSIVTLHQQVDCDSYQHQTGN